jgi:hypothetical protein
MAVPLRGAVAAFDAGLAGMRADDPLTDDLRHNLELAKRLLAAAPISNQADEPPVGQPLGQPSSPADGPDDRNPATGRDPVAAQTAADGTPLPKGKVGDSTSPQTTDKRPPGKGHLAPLPDEDALSPLTPEDAQAHLERAAERIATERRAQLQRTAPAVATRFRDW